MSFRIKLNGQLTPKDQHSTLLEADIKFTRDKSINAEFKTDFSANISFYGDAYRLIIDELVKAPGARANQVKIEIYDDCCKDADGEWRRLYLGKITSNDIGFCSLGIDARCKLTTSSKSNTSDDILYSCIRTKVVSANNSPDPNNPRLGFQYQEHPYVRYCYKIRPNFLHDIIIILGFGFWIGNFGLLLILLPFIAIIDFLNLLGAGIDLNDSQPGDQGLREWFIEAQKDIAEFLTGCEEGAITPYARSYINNVCTACGVNFESSILNDPASDYYNLAYFLLQSSGGDDDYYNGYGEIDEGTVRNYFDLNGPTDTGATFLDQLAEIFNCVWWIQDGTLYFEPEPKNQPVWLDLTGGNERKRTERLCYKVRGNPPCAFISLNYQKDMIDTVSNETGKWFNDYVDYQQTQFNTRPFNPNLEGECKNVFKFATTNFRKSGTSRDVIDTWAKFLAVFAIYDTQYDNALVLEKGSMIYPKLLIIDPTLGHRDFRYVVRRQRPNGYFYYNEGMWFAEGTDDPAIGKPAGGRLDSRPGYNWNMYRWWAKEDPEINPKLGVNFEIDLAYSCEDINMFLDNGVFMTVLLPYPEIDSFETKIGYVKTVTIKKNTLNIEGTI